MNKQLTSLVLAALVAPAAVLAGATPLSLQQVNDAQQAWCDSLVNIAKTYAAGGDYKTVAGAVLSNQYNYDKGTVLFRPTLAFGDQTFRLDKEGAAAYFIGGNPKYPNDDGFALKPWVSCRYTNAGGDAGVLIDGDFAATMGNVFITDAKGNETVVDKFFLFKRGDDAKLRIIVHKSALPFKPNWSARRRAALAGLY
ncbi:phosphoribosyl-AMP cyclohydrolase [uncultured Thiodictyon sp.]|uniref:phosphoribosyl-AMP cyclohydrolase n=1 Tax=uncultured Thiodictyon sp. TaxID=1846217 RepID=UPI0025D1C1C1|nr:phosphoribosyl-AMP cyclohydrolase [uncultured Thiodictyon sp.]